MPVYQIYVLIYVYVCVPATCLLDAGKGQKKLSDPLELE